VFDPDGNETVNLPDVDAFLTLYEDALTDCNGNQVLDLLDILLGTSMDADADGLPDECPLVALMPAGARYLTISMTGEFPAAIRVRCGKESSPGWYVDENGFLGGQPVIRLPSEWGDLHVGDEEVVPGATYTVTVESGAWSSAASATTYGWGDVNNAGGVNLDDILCVIQAFGGDFTLCTLYAADLTGFVPNRVVDLDDILAVVLAFGGAPYPGPNFCE
jgi:hypothetical protein